MAAKVSKARLWSCKHDSPAAPSKRWVGVLRSAKPVDDATVGSSPLRGGGRDAVAAAKTPRCAKMRTYGGCTRMMCLFLAGNIISEMRMSRDIRTRLRKVATEERSLLRRIKEEGGAKETGDANAAALDQVDV